jgi:hypothetical protein
MAADSELQEVIDRVLRAGTPQGAQPGSIAKNLANLTAARHLRDQGLITFREGGVTLEIVLTEAGVRHLAKQAI